MCGRYLVEIDEKELVDIVAEAEKNAHKLAAMQSFRDGEIFPTNIAPTISSEHGTVFMKWGFPSLLADKKPHINARSETLATAKTFSDSYANRRCLVPASGYYEWKPVDKKHKEKYIFTLPDRMMMYMAGIYSDDGGFAIITREATDVVSAIHDRMPVIIPHEFADAWLHESADVINDAFTDVEFCPVDSENMLSRQISLFG